MSYNDSAKIGTEPTSLSLFSWRLCVLLLSFPKTSFSNSMGWSAKDCPCLTWGYPANDLGDVWRTGMAKKRPGTNPRYRNGNFRRKMRARFRAMDAPCAICGGRLGPIHYDEPSDFKHPLSFVIDETRPVSRWKEFGYDSPESACLDISNLAPAHWTCNAAKGNKVGFKKLKSEITTSVRW